MILLRPLFALSALLGTGRSANAEEARDLVALGSHLAAECTSCHRPGGTSKAIPSLAGRPAADFAATLKEYQTGARTNPVMISVAQSLDERQIAALAAYFGSLPPLPPREKDRSSN
jgi:cytochrome c553